MSVRLFRTLSTCSVITSMGKSKRKRDPNLPTHGSDAKKPKERFSTRANQDSCRAIDKAMDDVFGHLGLSNLQVKAEIGPTKTRTHANPLDAKFQNKVELPSWEKIYADPKLPLLVDLGCAAGRFGIAAASHDKWKNHNHLGFEIRKPLVIRANAWAEKLELKNVFYVTASANFSLKDILKDYPGRIDIVAIQFPDPMFKRKQHKRRILQFPLLDDISEMLPQGGKLFLQSDVEEISAEMRDRASFCSYFKRLGSYSPRDEHFATIDECARGDIEEFWTRDGKRLKPDGADYGDWMTDENPTGIKTEREVMQMALGNPVYRSFFERNELPFTTPTTPPVKATTDSKIVVKPESATKAKATDTADVKADDNKNSEKS